MHKLIFSILIVVFTLNLNAQINIEFDTVFSAIYESDEIVGHNNFTNVIPQLKTFKWTRTEISMTDGWETSICDNNLCYLPSTSTQQISLGPNASSILDVHLALHGIYQGYALVEMKVEDVNNPSIFKIATYIFDSSSNSSEINKSKLDFIVYPNPSSGIFNIEQDNNLIDKVIIYNSLGQLINHYNIKDRSILDMQNLNNGTYLMKLVDNNGELLGTKIITKI